MKNKRYLRLPLLGALFLVLALPAWAGEINLAGGLLLSGETVSYSLGGSTQLVDQPPVYLDLLYGPQQGQAALGLSAPVRVGLDPLAKALGFTWAPWAEAALDRVNLGAACWKTTDDFPLRGGLYFRVTALEWEF